MLSKLRSIYSYLIKPRSLTFWQVFKTGGVYAFTRRSLYLIKRHPLFPAYFDYFGHQKRIEMATKKARPDEAIGSEDLI